MKKIDAHLHLAKVVAGYCRRGESRAIGDGKIVWGNGEVMQLFPKEIGGEVFTAEQALEIMDKHGVERAVLMQGSLYGFQNAYHKEILEKYPDRFCPSCTIDPFMTNAMEALENFAKSGFTLMKFEMSSGGGLMGCHDPFDLAGERMMPIYKLAERFGMTVALDVGDIPMASHQIMALVRIVEECPNLKLVICHLLAPMAKYHAEWLHELNILKDKNIWYDISSLPKILDDVLPFAMTVDYIREACDLLGAKRLMWGTDCPYATTRDNYEDLTEYLARSGRFTEEELEDIYYNTAKSVYFR